MRRREFIALIAGAAVAWPAVAPGQQLDRTPRLGVLFPGAPSRSTLFDALLDELRKLGYIDGKTILVELRAAEGRLERLPSLAKELVDAKVDIIVAATGAAVTAAKENTKQIPIVMASVGDPIVLGFVKSYSAPGGNITGIMNYHQDLGRKRVQLLKQAVPSASRIAVLLNALAPHFRDYLREAETAARELGIDIISAPVKRPEDLAGAFVDVIASKADGLIVPADSMTFSYRQIISDAAMNAKLPSMFAFQEEAVAGGLMSYGTDNEQQYRRAAHYVHKILSGAKASDLPVERPTKFVFVINLKTAKALGIEIPPALLALADEVIE